MFDVRSGNSYKTRADVPCMSLIAGRVVYISGIMKSPLMSEIITLNKVGLIVDRVLKIVFFDAKK